MTLFNYQDSVLSIWNKEAKDGSENVRKTSRMLRKEENGCDFINIVSKTQQGDI